MVGTLNSQWVAVAVALTGGMLVGFQIRGYSLKPKCIVGIVGAALSIGACVGILALERSLDDVVRLAILGGMAPPGYPFDLVILFGYILVIGAVVGLVMKPAQNSGD